ncbi:hypothetical protein O181_031454 [Austropuccinia psidii MF-1]|uniref:Uncharacterized protein n=1 Tax=Austropuccinia psidii MF-1 TaxID=1389203 RepID=A0A9Q3H6K0_9BASI|nr:hypothetical protein [Austropuccinia psidii MF-1]
MQQVQAEDDSSDSEVVLIEPDSKFNFPSSNVKFRRIGPKGSLPVKTLKKQDKGVLGTLEQSLMTKDLQLAVQLKYNQEREEKQSKLILECDERKQQFTQEQEARQQKLKILEIEKNNDIRLQELNEKVECCKAKVAQESELIKLEIEERRLKVEIQKASMAGTELEKDWKNCELNMKERDVAMREKQLSHEIQTAQNTARITALTQLVPKGASAEEMERVLKVVFKR